MADVDFASLAQEQPYVVAAGLGLIGIVLFLLFGRKSYGAVPGACPLVPDCHDFLVPMICLLRYSATGIVRQCNRNKLQTINLLPIMGPIEEHVVAGSVHVTGPSLMHPLLPCKHYQAYVVHIKKSNRYRLYICKIVEIRCTSIILDIIAPAATGEVI